MRDTVVKKIGVLTSGGDCAGLNAAIRAITHRAIMHYGWQVVGIRKGITGLINRPLEYQILSLDNCDAMLLRSGGTMLGSTNRDDPFNFPQEGGSKVDRSQDIINGYHELELDALIGIGGDGSMHVLRKLAQQGNLNLITIPKTIDNDLGITENAIGYQTAIEVATEALDRLQPTAASHQRVMVLEVMGRDAGHIAIASGIAGGADVILVPEIPYTLDNIYRKINSLSSLGKNFALIVVAEAVRDEKGNPVIVSHKHERMRYGGVGHYLGEKIMKATGADVRVMVLGHVQRGGQPLALDRIIASAFGVKAVDLIAEGKYDRMVAWQNRQVVDVPIEEAIATYRALQPDDLLVNTARGLGICLGDN
jgi:6-phosphofructokinase 1